MYMKNMGPQIDNSTTDVQIVKFELELREMWRLINWSMDIFS